MAGCPLSIREAARRVGRDVKAVHGDVTALLKEGVIDRSGRLVVFPYDGVHVVSDERAFANALRDLFPEFELIRGIANSAKHLQLRGSGGHAHSPSHAANTRVQSTGWGEGGFGMGPWGGSPRVMLETGSTSGDLKFSDIATTVLNMRKKLAQQYGRPLQ